MALRGAFALLYNTCLLITNIRLFCPNSTNSVSYKLKVYNCIYLICLKQQLLEKIVLIVLFYVLDYMRSWYVENEKPIPSDNEINGCYTNQVTYARELLGMLPSSRKKT